MGDDNDLLEAAKLAYRKLHLKDWRISNEEVIEELSDALSKAMGGAEKFKEWAEEYDSRPT